MSVTVGGYIPTGYADGDKVYILIGLGGGNNSFTSYLLYLTIKFIVVNKILICYNLIRSMRKIKRAVVAELAYALDSGSSPG